MWHLLHVTATSLLRLKQQISKLTARDRVEIAAYLHRLKQATPTWKNEMTRRLAEMDRGVKFKLSARPGRRQNAAA
jgi:hypothetical protein